MISKDMLENVEIRRSTRAKHLHIKVTAYGQVIVVVPKRVKKFNIESILDSHKDWIDTRLNKVAIIRQDNPFFDDLLPDKIELKLTTERFDIHYDMKADKDTLREIGEALYITATNELVVGKILKKWLQVKARQLLPPLLSEMAEQTSLSFKNVTVRGQKTRWGSCSAAANINLNRNLLFLPEPLVRHLMLHELCHTRHLNHSVEYWKFVES
ncbi:MAG: M48 family metallopeptidase, partial [Gammaproteobacteria bacterium]|nr:M48 family metallopeptidase [Gammaproteobacteria bacterium]